MFSGVFVATHISKRWQSSFHGMSRKDRKGCTYHAYIPDPLCGWDPPIPADVVADLADADAAIRDLNHAGLSLVSLEGVARFLMRTESVASSRIEGLTIGARRMARAEARLALGHEIDDVLAAEIIGNVSAMTTAIAKGSSGRAFTCTDLLALHRQLLQDTHPKIAGVLRTEQNWIGGSSYNPCNAAFVPPPPDHLAPLLADLVVYMNSDAHSPLVQSAFTHAQFETLHPFADGNGRTGRALIHVVLRSRGLTPNFSPPISLVLARKSKDYIAGLTTFRHLDTWDSQARAEGAVIWLRTFAMATRQACADAARYTQEIASLQREWREKLGDVREKSGTDLLLQQLPGIPVLTTASASATLGRSKARTIDAIDRLAEAGILVQRNIGKQRYRVFEAPDILALYTALDESLHTCS